MICKLTVIEIVCTVSCPISSRAERTNVCVPPGNCVIKLLKTNVNIAFLSSKAGTSNPISANFFLLSSDNFSKSKDDEILCSSNKDEVAIMVTDSKPIFVEEIFNITFLKSPLSKEIIPLLSLPSSNTFTTGGSCPYPDSGNGIVTVWFSSLVGSESIVISKSIPELSSPLSTKSNTR